MTEFVPQTLELSGDIAAIKLGDWLLQILNVKKPTKHSKIYYEKLCALLKNSSGSVHMRTSEYIEFFDLFMREAETVYNFLDDAYENGGVIIHVLDTESPKSVEKQVHKTYTEVLKEVEQYFILLMYIVSTRFPNENSSAIDKAIDKLSSILMNSKRHSESRLKLLKTLYNIFTENAEIKFKIFSNIVKYSSNTNQFNSLLPYIKLLPEWVKDWDISNEKKREIYLIIANQLKSLGKAEEAYPFLKKYIQLAPPYESLSKNSEGYLELFNAVKEFFLDSISLPDVYYFDSILELDAFQSANKEGTENSSNLLNLHQILSTGFPRDLEAFKMKNPNFFEELGIKYSTCLNKIRLLSLTSLASQQKELLLSTVCENLEIDEDEAQELAVKTIGLGLIDAKIDQLNKVIHIRSAMQRKFSEEQWNDLLEKLKKWTENVANLLSYGKSELI